MHLLLPIVALIVGTLIGLQLPDADHVFTLVLTHRSILTHSFLLPLGLYLLAKERERWMTLGSVGVSLAVAVHLAFDLFPRRWVGFAQLYAPLVGRLDMTISVLWIAASMGICCALGLKLLRDRRDLAVGLIAMAGGFVIAARTEAAWFMPLVGLILAFALATCLPNPVIDGRATARRWTAIARAMRRP